MILIDTNILIAAIRVPDPAPLIAQMRANDGAVCGVVRAEFLHGARTQAGHLQALTVLNALGQIPTPEGMWDEVGANLRVLRSQGIAVPFPDAVLATLAIVNGLELWTRDNHFLLMRNVLPSLRLFPEPAQP